MSDTNSTSASHKSRGVANKLTSLQVFNLYTYLRETSHSWTHDTTKEKLAAEVSEKYSFTCNTNNVYYALQQLELKLPEGPKSDTQKLAIMAQAIFNLHQTLGVALPDGWKDVSF